MCVIFMSPTKESRPTLAQLEAGEDANKHGAGMSWLEGGKVRFIKGLNLTAQEIWNRMHRIEGPMLIHFRLASSGPKIDELCHPFPLSASEDQLDALEGVADAVFMHNGTIKDDVWKDLLLRTDLSKMIGGQWSDSRALAYLMGTYKNYHLLGLIDGWNKFAVMTPQGIRYWGNWIDQDRGLMTSCAVITKTWSYSKKDDDWEKRRDSWKKKTGNDNLSGDDKELLSSIVGFDTEKWTPAMWDAYGEGASIEELLAMAEDEDEAEAAECYAGYC